MTRGIPNDYSDKRFGRLVVLHRSGSDRHNNALWSCRCDCGNVVSVRGAFLKRGQEYCAKQCPLYRRQKRLDLVGQRFGRLLAIAFLRFGAQGKAIWSFGCDCGVTVERTADGVITGNISSCGCLGRESRVKHGLSQTREYHREAHRRWSKENRGKVIANANKRRADYVQRIPKWLTDAQWTEIEAFYAEARRKEDETGIVHHVDHIVPLRGKTVSGLHVPWNLQVLTEKHNLQKSARLLDEVC